MFQAFAECGAVAWMILFLALIAVALGVAAVGMASSSPRAARTASLAALAMVALVSVAGVGGTFLGRAKVDRAVANALSTYQETLREEGYREAAQCTVIAAGADALPLLLAIVALALASRQR